MPRFYVTCDKPEKLRVHRPDLSFGNKTNFLPTYDNYSFDPGGELAFKRRALPALHPFISSFGEYLFLKGRPADTPPVPDNYLLPRLGACRRNSIVAKNR